MGALHKRLLTACAAMSMCALCGGTTLATASDAEAFAQRAGDHNRPGTISAALGAYPAGWNSPVPLPTGMPLLGSVSVTSQHSVEAFYRPSNARSAFNAYAEQLRAAGFLPKEIPAFGGGGFAQARAVPYVSLFCHGPQGVDVQVPDSNSDDLRVTVLSGGNEPLNPCIANKINPAQDFANPLPALIAPPGVVEITGLGGNTSFGYTAIGPSANVSTTVLLQGMPDAATIVNAYAREFEKAGWRKTDAIASKLSAAAAFTTIFREQTWTAMLALYPGSAAHHYVAILNSSGKPVAGAPKFIRPAPTVLPHLKKSDEPAVVQLLKRQLNADGTQRVGIYLHRTAPQWPAGLPLPSGDLLGSTSVAPQLTVDNGAQSYVSLYYALTQSELDAYLHHLQQGGWREQGSPFGAQGGFVPSQAASYAYCKQASPGLNVFAVSGSNAVTISAAPGQTAAQCGVFPEPPRPPEMSLPKLHAPGAVVSRWSTQGLGNAASFTSSLAPAALLDAFAQQLEQLGWKAGSRAANDNVGTQSFTHTEGSGKRSEASLTLYRYTGQPSGYGAIIDVTTLP